MAEKFHIGITMAGAVSAGAYTAGVIDYLFEALQRWEQEKQQGRGPVPDHNVQIDVIGGASAGGMTAALTAIACFTGLVPVTDYAAASVPDYKPRNLLFDTWVNLVDNDRQTTFEQMLETSDLTKGTVPSLLNSIAIDAIAAKAVNAMRTLGRPENFPSFVSPNLDLLLTLCSLRGIPIDVEFNSDNTSRTNPRHQMQTHKMFARFKMGLLSDSEEAFALPVDSGGSANLEFLLECAKSTGAFPVGLASRKIEQFKKGYIQKQFGDIMNIREEYLTRIFHDQFSDPFPFTSIDGGTLNNEPFSELATLLNKNHSVNSKNVAMLLVDPFPNFEGGSSSRYEHPASLENLIAPILGTLRHQSMLKERDILADSSPQSYKKNMIFPSRPERINGNIGKAKGNHISCGALGGFSGFIDRRFRVHDFFLGRHNCRNFLRFFFALPCPKNNRQNWPPIFQNWDQQMIDRHKVKESDTNYLLPIIPSFDFVDQVERRIAAQPPGPINLREINFIEANGTWDIPFPQIDAKEVLALETPIQNRLKAIVDSIMGRLKDSDTVELTDEEKRIRAYLEKEFRKGWWARTKSFLLGDTIKWLAKREIVSQATNFSLKAILNGLHESKLLRF